VADQTSSWALKLEDQVSGSAETAAQALENLEKQISADTKQLAAMQKAMRNLQGGSSVNIEQFRKLKAGVDAQKQSIAKAQQQYLSLGGSFNTARKSGSGFAERLAALQKQTSSLPGPLGNAVGQLSKLRTVLGGGVIATGILAIAAALAALVVATGAAVRSLYNYGVAQADARRSELLRLDGLTKMRFMYARTAGNAKEMQEAIDRVAASTPTSRAELVKYTDQLYRMGLRGKALEKTLEGVSIKASTQGDAAATAFAGWAAGSNLAGRGVDKLVDKVKSRLGGIAQKQMSSLTVQAEKQKEAFDALFTGLDIEGWLSAWKGVRDLLSQATASGRALKFMLQGILRPLIDGSTQGASIVKRFFQGIIIAALQVTIAILTIRKW
jgi:hypothetical protein